MALALPSLVPWWQPSLPGYVFKFPSDYAAHERARSEWWYYTGNLADGKRHRYGFELTLFRVGIQAPAAGGSAWDINDIYFAHLAVSDIDAKHFYFFDRTGRAAWGQAGAKTGDEDAWLQDWHLQRTADGVHRLHARAGGIALSLALTPRKHQVIHGRRGVSLKGACRSCASHYYSFTRLEASGSLALGAAAVRVSGSAWNDHEWGSDELQSGVAGWDWFSIQLRNGVEIMLYRLRRTDGTSVPQSSGTVIDAGGGARYVPLRGFAIRQTGVWRSPHSGGRYPSGWHVSLPGFKAELDVSPLLEDQELMTPRSTGMSYWEGACAIEGRYQGRKVRGVGYTELTGYAGKSFP